jgi:hypothetical protein
VSFAACLAARSITTTSKLKLSMCHETSYQLGDVSVVVDIQNGEIRTLHAERVEAFSVRPPVPEMAIRLERTQIKLNETRTYRQCLP